MPHLYNFDLGAIINIIRNLRLNAGRTTPSQRVIAVSVTVSIFVLGILARYLKRRKRVPFSKSRNLYKRLPDSQVLSIEGARQRSPSIRSIRRQGSVLSGPSVISETGSKRNLPCDYATDLTPQQLGVMVEAFTVMK